MKSRWLVSGLVLVCAAVSAQTQPQTQSKGKTQVPPAQAQPGATSAKPPQGTATTSPTPTAPRGNVVEEIVARVNGEIITTIDLTRAKASVVDEAKQDCTTNKCTPEELQQTIADRQKDALRDLIDQALLIQRAKDLDITVETDLVKQLDQIRQQYKLASLEDLEKAVEAEGTDWEEFKTNMRNHLLVDAVIYREVSSKVSGDIDRNQMQKYYEEHKEDFVLPEGVRIREILVSTDGKPEADIPALEKKAQQLRERVLNGEDFGTLAAHFSDGSTAKQNGELGGFERGKLSKQIEDIVFKLNRNEMTPVMHMTNGFLVIQVEERYEAGIQPFEKVENEIMNRMASTKMAPRLREYLDNLRRDSYLDVRPGYVDTGGATSDASITEANGTTGDITKPNKPPKKHKRFLIF